jgi:hypothetical protein
MSRYLLQHARSFAGLAVALAVSLACASAASAQEASPPVQSNEGTLTQTAKVIAGAALGLAVHESGHLTFDLLLGAPPGLKRVSYAGIPFFAITHHPVSPTKEFTISSAGFWAQHASSELILTRRPYLRDSRAPVMKGLLAFNVVASVVYAGAAIKRTGPEERDTRGMAVSARIAEPWVAPMILAPAVLDTVRYFRPESRTARWASRAAKIGGLLLVLRAKS